MWFFNFYFLHGKVFLKNTTAGYILNVLKTPILHNSRYIHQQKKQTFAKDLISGSLSCMRPAVSTSTTSQRMSQAEFKSKILTV